MSDEWVLTIENDRGMEDWTTGIGGRNVEMYKIREVKLNEGITYIGNGAFEYCSMTDITIPEGVTGIGGNLVIGQEGSTKPDMGENKTPEAGGNISIGGNVTPTVSNRVDSKGQEVSGAPAAVWLKM